MIKAEHVKNYNNDLTVVNAARVSFNKESKFDDDGKLSNRDVKLINYLASHDHWTPFSHCRFTFRAKSSIINKNINEPTILTGLVFSEERCLVRHSVYGWVQLIKSGYVYKYYIPFIIDTLIKSMPNSFQSLLTLYEDHPRQKNIELLSDDFLLTPNFIDVTMRETVPIFVARQRFKHTVQCDYNEVSRRYVNDDPDFHIPTKWRGAPTNGAKQGSSSEVVKDIYFDKGNFVSKSNVYFEYYDHLKNSKNLYKSMISSGVAPEQARMVLPQSMITSYYVTSSLSAWARAYRQRINSHAQEEIKILSRQWDKILSDLHGETWKNLIN